MKFSFSRLFKKQKPAVDVEDYSQRVKNEIDFYKDCLVVHELPEIFHYWSNKYLLPKQLPFGFSSPDDFFIKQCTEYCESHPELDDVRILSVGSGNGDLEIRVAAAMVNAGHTNFTIECMDINPHMLERTLEDARSQGVQAHIKTREDDFNRWTPDRSYDVIMANQSLHHVLELEHLFGAIYKGLKKTGKFITSDMIGRNGHKRWPEAMQALKPFWDELPDSHKYNQLLKRHEEDYINHDCSTEGFEGIRAQDILPLLVKKFHFHLFIPFSNIVMVFIDRPFGHNFDAENPWDRDFIDRVHACDEAGMLTGTLKPTQMLAVMSKTPTKTVLLSDPKLTPEFCIRKPD